MSGNNAVIKIIAKHTREYNVLLSEHNVLLKVHVKTVNDFADKCMVFDKLKSDNKILRAIVLRFERENKSLQQSIEDCQGELERANEKMEKLYDCGDDLRNFNDIMEGEGGL